MAKKKTAAASKKKTAPLVRPVVSFVGRLADGTKMICAPDMDPFILPAGVDWLTAGLVELAEG